jgi:hypothetical protein
MRCNERRDRPKIEARRLVERRRLPITDLTLSTFSGVRAVRGRPVDVLFITDPVVRNDSTHRSIVLWSGIAPSRATLNCRRKRRWTVTTESLFLKKKNARLQKGDAQCSTAAWLLNWSLRTTLRRSGKVADLHSPDDYPFQKYAFIFAPPGIFKTQTWTPGSLTQCIYIFI